MRPLLKPTDAVLDSYYWLFRNDATDLKLVQAVTVKGGGICLRSTGGCMVTFRDVKKLEGWSMYEIPQPETMEYDLRRARLHVEKPAEIFPTRLDWL